MTNTNIKTFADTMAKSISKLRRLGLKEEAAEMEAAATALVERKRRG